VRGGAVERINRKVFKETGKLDRPQQYGPGEFFSIASLHIVTDELSDKYDSKCDECDDSKLCLLVRNEDGSNGYKCECPDNSDLGVDGACLAGTTKEYSIINCPAATIVSADKCRLVADYAIEYPSIESDGVVESPENFEWNFYSRFSGGDRDAFTFSDSKADKVLQLKQGRTVIVLEGTKNEGADEVRCSWSVDVSVATCDWTNIFLPADVEPFQSSCQPTGSFVMPGEKEPSGQLINLRCKDEAKRIQPYLNGVKFQDVEDKSASLRSLTTSSDLSECENREDLGGEGIVAKECKVTRGGSDLPMKSMLYECKPDAEDNKFVHPFSHLVEGDITFKCEIPASPPRGLPATPTEDNNEDVTPKSMDTDAEKTADSPKKKSFAGLIIFFVILLVAVVGFILYKRMKNEYGGFSVRNLVNRPAAGADMQVPASSTPYAAM